jgi:hypothetical protein
MIVLGQDRFSSWLGADGLASVKDISLAEIAARLAEERGLTACPATIRKRLEDSRLNAGK